MLSAMHEIEGYAGMERLLEATSRLQREQIVRI